MAEYEADGDEDAAPAAEPADGVPWVAPSAREVREAVSDALTDVFASRERSLLTRWTLVAEVIGQGGDRAVWTLSEADMLSYDIVGLLEYSRDRERARHHCCE